MKGSERMKKRKPFKKIILDFTIMDYEKNLEELLRIIENLITFENLIYEDLYEITTSLITKDGKMVLESVIKILSRIYEIIPLKNFFYSTTNDKSLTCNNLRIIIQITLL